MATKAKHEVDGNESSGTVAAVEEVLAAVLESVQSGETITDGDVEYGFNADEAGHADDIANRIDQNAAYKGTFKTVQGIVSAQKGTQGLQFEFEAPGGGTSKFTLYTKRADGTSIFGMNLVQAMMLIFGLKGLKSEKGKVMVYDEDLGKSVEDIGNRFTQLEGKQIGCVFQKELYTKSDNNEGWRMNLYGVFDAKTGLTASEIKEKKVEGVKLERMLRGLKTKDARKKREAEPAQPGLGIPDGDY